MNSICFDNKDSVLQHYHKIEIVKQSENTKASQHKQVTLTDKVRQIAADVLIVVGFLITAFAIVGIVAHSFGALAVLPPMQDLLTPAIASILTGFHLKDHRIKTDIKLQIPTLMPGLNFIAS